jgi:hypothetical protein
MIGVSAIFAATTTTIIYPILLCFHQGLIPVTVQLSITVRATMVSEDEEMD